MSGRKDQLEDLRARLRRWAAQHHDPDATVARLRAVADPHGSTYAFDVVVHGAVVDALLLRLDDATALHEMRTLAVMRRARITVPEARFWDDDPQWFGQAYLMVERPTGGRWAGGADLAAVGCALDRAVDVLGSIHLVDWRRDTDSWPEPISLGADVRRVGARAGGDDEDLADAAWELAERLLLTIPRNVTIGIVHGDFRLDNVHFGDALAVEVRGWGHSYVGGQLLDVGWLAANTDGADCERVAARYAAATGQELTVADVAWSMAVAFLRLGDVDRSSALLARTVGGRETSRAGSVLPPSRGV